MIQIYNNSISSFEECKNVTVALLKQANSSTTDDRIIKESITDLKTFPGMKLLEPFGCLYSDDPKGRIYWSASLSIQYSLPCGSKYNGYQYFCFCKRQSKLKHYLQLL